MLYPVRKSTRLPGFDYTQPNYYFVTICAHEKQCLFGAPDFLNGIGKIAYTEMENLPSHYSGVFVDCFVIMPNHVHAILVLENTTVSLDKIIGLYKSGVSRRARPITQGKPLWQRSFHDHVIRNQASYEKIWNYVTHNSQKWEDDYFYPAGKL